MPTLIQQSAALNETGNNDSEVVETWNIAADSFLVGSVLHTSSANRVHLMSDSVFGNWVELQTNAEGSFRRQSLFVAVDHPGGSNVDIVVGSLGSIRKYAWVWEFTKSAIVDSDNNGNGAGVLEMLHSSLGINAPAGVQAIAAHVNNSAPSDRIATPGWDWVYGTDSTQWFAQRLDGAPSPLVAEQAPVSIGDVGRAYSAVIVAFEDAGAPPTSLIVQDTRHGQSSEDLDLTVELQIGAQSSRHGQSSQNLDLVQANILAIADAQHGHSAEQIELATTITLALQDVFHFHTSDTFPLEQASTLVLEDARHVQRTPQLALGTGITLTVAAVSHPHGSETLEFTTETPLVLEDVRHVQASGNVDLVVAGVLEILDSRHRHRSTQVIILDEQIGVAEREGTLVVLEAEPLVVIEVGPIVVVQ